MLKPHVMFRHHLGGPWSSSISGSFLAFFPSRSCPVSPPSSHFNPSQMLSDVEGKHVQCEEQGSFQAHSPGRTETAELNPVHFWLLSNTWGFSLILLSNISGKVFTLLPLFMPFPFWHMWCVHVLQLCTNELSHHFQQPFQVKNTSLSSGSCYDIFSTLGNNHFKVLQGIPRTFWKSASLHNRHNCNIMCKKKSR